ncbi:MAG: inositol monophosphatase [Lachnospiraceae bacterium]|nr:inositol monophosphatase [Lachnospiraceae bacterium]
MHHQIDIEFVKKTIMEAADIFSNKESVGKIVTKGRADFVTAVDMQVQQLMQERLTAKYPQIQFMSEELDNSAINKEDYMWVLDPVDGTTNLIHDFKRSAISLALMKGGESLLGFIYNPYARELFYAIKGEGSYLNGEPIRVSEETQMADSLITVGTTPYYKELARENFGIIEKLYGDCVDIRRTGSAALDLADVACGRTEGYFEKRLKIWDYAAGMLIVREAGGEVYYFDGRLAAGEPAGDIVAGNRTIVEILRKEYL